MGKIFLKTKKDGINVLKVIGKINKDFFVELKSELAQALKNGSPALILDLSEIKEVKLAVFGAISVLLNAFIRGGGVVATIVSDSVKVEDLKKGNFGDIFHPYVNMDDAIDFLKGHFQFKEEEQEKALAAEELTAHIERKYWVTLDKLKIGDILATPIHDSKGTMIIKENTPITDKVLRRLESMEIDKVQILLLEREARKRNLVERQESASGFVELKEDSEGEDTDKDETPSEETIRDNVTFEYEGNVCVVKFKTDLQERDIDILMREMEVMRADLVILDMSNVQNFDIKLILPFTNAIYSRDDIGRCIVGLKKSIESLFKNVSALRYIRLFPDLETALQNKEKILQSVYIARKNNIITKELKDVHIGERLARPIFDRNGRLLYKANEPINEKIVEELSREGITAVDILKGN